MISNKKTTVFNTFGTNSASGDSSSEPLKYRINTPKNYRLTYGRVIFRITYMMPKCTINCKEIVAKIDPENSFDGGCSGDSTLSGFDDEMKKKIPAINTPEMVIWLPRNPRQIVQIPVLHAVHVQNGHGISPNKTVERENDVDLEGRDLRAAAKAQNLKN